LLLLVPKNEPKNKPNLKVVCSGHILWEETKCRQLAITAIVKYYRTERIRLHGVAESLRKRQNEVMSKINRAELHDI